MNMSSMKYAPTTALGSTSQRHSGSSSRNGVDVTDDDGGIDHPVSVTAARDDINEEDISNEPHDPSDDDGT
jgi:hypothetical protein